MNAASPDQCYFIEYQKIKDKWGMTDFQEVTVLKDVVDLKYKTYIITDS